MKRIAKTTFDYILSALIIWLCLLAGRWIQSWLGLTLPASIIGMILLFLLLATGLVKEHWVSATANLFLRYLLLIFIPISVGLMAHFELLLDNAMPLLLSTVGVTTLVIIIVSKGLQKLLGSSEFVPEKNQEEE